MLSYRQPGHKCIMLLEMQCLARMLASWQTDGMAGQAQSAELPVASRARKGLCSRMRRTVRRSWSGTSLGALSGWIWQTLPTPMGMVSMCITAVVIRTIGWLTVIVVLLEASHGPMRSLLASHRPCRALRQEWPYGIWHAPRTTVQLFGMHSHIVVYATFHDCYQQSHAQSVTACCTSPAECIKA